MTDKLINNDSHLKPLVAVHFLYSGQFKGNVVLYEMNG